jgi:hypothetical protein
MFEQFSTMCAEIQVSMKSDNKDGYFIEIPIYIYDNISPNSSLDWEMFGEKYVEKIKKNKCYAQ